MDAAASGEHFLAPGKRKRHEDGAPADAQTVEAAAVDALRPPSSFTLFKYEGAIITLFCKGPDGLWCRICGSGPLQLGNGSF
jgi:hypothetical protein